MKDRIITGRLEEWSVQMVGRKEYMIWGRVADDIHSRFEDGSIIHTSGILVKDHPVHSLKEGSVVTTRNSTYLLGVKQSDK